MLDPRLVQCLYGRGRFGANGVGQGNQSADVVVRAHNNDGLTRLGKGIEPSMNLRRFLPVLRDIGASRASMGARPLWP
jgi:hypothetical protein